MADLSSRETGTPEALLTGLTTAGTLLWRCCTGDGFSCSDGVWTCPGMREGWVGVGGSVCVGIGGLLRQGGGFYSFSAGRKTFNSINFALFPFSSQLKGSK